LLLIDPEVRTAAETINFLGGLNAVRQGHLFLTWIFIAFTIIHVYMALTEDYSKVKLIFFGLADEK